MHKNKPDSPDEDFESFKGLPGRYGSLLWQIYFFGVTGHTQLVGFASPTQTLG
jgi:hypothetical protein